MISSLGELEPWNDALVRDMPCALVGLDTGDRIVLWNPAAERLLGYARNDAVGRPWSDFAIGSGRRLRHRLGYDVPVKQHAVAARDGVVRAFFLEPASNLLEATKLVVNDVLQQLPAFFSVIGLDLRYRMVCRSCELLFGRPRHEIEGRPVREMFGEDAFVQVAPLLERAVSGHAAHGEFHAVGADGQIHFLRVHFQPLRLSNREAEAIFAFAYDVTALRQTEATLRDSEGRLKFLIKNHPDLVVIVGRDFKLRFINHTEPDPETPPEALAGIDVIELSPPEYRGWLREQYETVWKTGKPMDVEVPIVWRGQMRWFSSRLVPLPNGEQPPAEMLVVSRETTRRVQMERALKQHETHFKQFAEALEDVVWIHDANPERVVFVNRSFEKLWGLSRDELYKNPRLWVSSIHADDRERVSATFQAVLDGASLNFDVEYRLTCPDGSQRWIHDYGVAIRDDSGRPLRLTGIARDITARKVAEDERQEFQRQLLETQKLESLGVLAGGIAHDFNNLLAGILGSVNLAQVGDGLDPAIKRHLEQIETISLRAGELCKQMLAYAGKGKFDVTLFDLNGLIEEISHLVNISISKKVALHSHLTANLPSIRGDASQLRQVLLNLVINASEAFGDRVGDIRIATGETNLTADDLATFQFGADLAPGRFVFLEVSDNGPGMAPDVVERIFEPFFTTKFPGRGLGLAAVQGIMRSHGGAIRVVSKLAMGTVFTLLLPPAAEAAPKPETSPPTHPLRASGTALIVDDEDIIRETLSMMLQSFGFTVLTARDGQEAIQTFGRRHDEIKIVLLDLTMPVLSGDEAHAELVRINPNVPVIFMSGFMEQDLAERCRGHKVAGFLEKPFRMEALERMIGMAMGQ